MSHDLPIDVAVELVARYAGTDALMAGPRRGLDITASAHWFAALAPEIPDLEAALADLPAWEWTSEDGGTTPACKWFAGPGTTARTRAPSSRRRREASPLLLPQRKTCGPRMSPPTVPPADEEQAREQSRRLVARVWDRDTVVESVLPPASDLRLAVRIALPEKGDIAADEPAPLISIGEESTVELEVAVRSDVWEEQPATQTISMSRDKLTLPSSWAVFAFSTPPEEGRLVSIEIVLLYQGKPLQAATYVSPGARCRSSR